MMDTADVAMLGSEILMAIAGVYAVIFAGSLLTQNTAMPRPTKFLLIFTTMLGVGFFTYGARHAIFCLQPLCDTYWSTFPLMIASQVVLAIMTFGLGCYTLLKVWKGRRGDETGRVGTPKMAQHAAIGQTLVWGVSLGMVTAYSIYVALFGVSNGSILMRPWIFASMS